MASSQDGAFKVAGLIFMVIASLLTFFGLLRFMISDINDHIGDLKERTSVLEATAKPAEYYQDINKRLTVNEIKVEACLVGER